MEINADFTQRAAVHAAQLSWIGSPIAGVDRRMLDRIGDEVARATSIVRYAPRSHFSPHTHGGGEEFLVLDGVFQDEHGDFPVGTYIRNPPTSSHQPGSEPGCVIFVKLWQFDPGDRQHVSIDTARGAFTAAPERPGVEVMPLFADDVEDVRLERWKPDARIAFGSAARRRVPGARWRFPGRRRDLHATILAASTSRQPTPRQGNIARLQALGEDRPSRHTHPRAGQRSLMIGQPPALPHLRQGDAGSVASFSCVIFIYSYI